MHEDCSLFRVGEESPIGKEGGYNTPMSGGVTHFEQLGTGLICSKIEQIKHVPNCSKIEQNKPVPKCSKQARPQVFNFWTN